MAVNHFLCYFVNSSSCCGRVFFWQWISSLHYLFVTILFSVLFCEQHLLWQSVHLAVDHFLYNFVNRSCCGRVFIWWWISGLHYIFFTTLYCSCSSVHLAVDQRPSGGEYSTSVCLWQLRKPSETKFQILNEYSTTEFLQQLRKRMDNSNDKVIFDEKSATKSSPSTVNCQVNVGCF